MERTKTEVIAAAIERARALGLTQAYDVALTVMVDLADAGYRIGRAPQKAAR